MTSTPAKSAYGTQVERWLAIVLLSTVMTIFPSARAQEAPSEVPPEMVPIVRLWGHIRALEVEGRYAEILDDSRKLYALEKALPNLPVTHLLYAELNLGNVLNQLAQYAEAGDVLEANLEHFRAAYGRESAEAARCMTVLAQVRIGQEDYAAALALQKETLRIQEKTLPANDPQLAMTLGDMGFTYLRLGEFEKAYALRARAQKSLESAGLAESAASAVNLGQMAVLKAWMGEYPEAWAINARALQISEKVSGPDHPDTLRLLGSLADLHSLIGQDEQAVAVYEKMLPRAQRTFGAEHPDTAAVMDRLGVLDVRLGRVPEGLALQERALALTEARLGPSAVRTALCLNNLGYSYGTVGNFEKSVPLMTRAFDAYRTALGPSHLNTAVAESNLGMMLARSGRQAEGLPLEQEGLAIAISDVGLSHPSVAELMRDLGRTYHSMGEAENAIFWLKQSVNIQQVVRRDVATMGAEQLRLYSTSVADPYRELAALLMAEDRLPEALAVLDLLKESEQFEFIERSGTLDPRHSSLEFSAKERSWTQCYEHISADLVVLTQEAHALQSLPQRSAEQNVRLTTLQSDLQLGRRALVDFISTLRGALGAQGATRSEDLAQIDTQSVVETRALLRGFGAGTVLVQYFLLDDRVNVLITTSDVQLGRTIAIAKTDLDARLVAYLQALKDPNSDVLPGARGLYDLLFLPIRHDLDAAGAKVVMLSLDGSLRYLPFAALHDGQSFLVEHYDLPIYTAAAKSHLQAPVATAWSAVGFGATQAAPGFAALPGVRRELQGIIKEGSHGVLRGTAYFDGAFTATRLKDAGAGLSPVIHVASHFQFSPGTEADSFLLLGDGSHLSLGDLRRQNYRFDHTDLITLSACNTGLGGGHDRQGKEIEGFGTLAQELGAKAVLASLWQVSDESTAILMKELYSRKTDLQLSKAEALRQAQNAVRQHAEYRHPFYWAPFILMGNWK